MRNTIHANRTILKVYSGIFSPLSAQRYVMPSVTVTEYLFNDVHFRIILYWYWVPVHIWWMHMWRCQNHSRYRMNAHVKMSISFLYKHFLFVFSGFYCGNGLHTNTNSESRWSSSRAVIITFIIISVIIVVIIRKIIRIVLIIAITAIIRQIIIIIIIL